MDKCIHKPSESLYLGHFAHLSDLISYYPEGGVPGMYFINEETGSIWIWDGISNHWINTCRASVGNLIDGVVDDPLTFVPANKKGIPSLYLYLTSRVGEVIFTHFRNGGIPVSITVSQMSIISLFWDGDIWKITATSFSLVPTLPATSYTEYRFAANESAYTPPDISFFDLSPGEDWQEYIPTITPAQFLWMTCAKFNVDGDFFDPNQGWSFPVRLTGKDGDGSDGDSLFYIDLSNDTHVIPTQSDGTGGNYTGAETTASVYEGTRNVSAFYTFNSFASEGVVFSTSNNGRTIAVTSLEPDSGFIWIWAEREGFPTLKKQFSISKSKQGETSIIYRIGCTTPIIRRTQKGTHIPEQLSAEALKQEGGAMPASFNGWFRIHGIQDNRSRQMVYTSASAESSFSIPVVSLFTSYEIELFKEKENAVFSTLLDRELIPIVSDGADGNDGSDGSDGLPGASIRMRGEWTAGNSYVSNTEFRDVVIYENRFYIAKKLVGTVPTGTLPTDVQWWESFVEFENIATSVLLAENAWINILNTNGILIGENGWEMTMGQIKHKRSGLTLTADGVIKAPANGILISTQAGYEPIDTEFAVSKAYVDSIQENLQMQIDGQIESWFYQYTPTLSNYPASSWNTDNIKLRHVGDTFTNTEEFVDSVSTPNAGKSWRFVFENDLFKWTPIADSDAVKALLEAAKAKDAADGKRRVFTNRPVVPYDAGDLWVQGLSGDIMVCVNARSIGVFAEADWSKASKYTDDGKANEVFESLAQYKFENDGFRMVINQQIESAKSTADSALNSASLITNRFQSFTAAGGTFESKIIETKSYADTVGSKTKSWVQSQSYSTIAQTADAIRLEVNNLKLNGINLIRNSKYIEKEVTEAGLAYIGPIDLTAGKSYIFSFKSNSGSGPLYFNTLLDWNKGVGQTVQPQTSFTATRNFAHVWAKTANETVQPIGSKIRIEELKLEEGSNVTTWTPALEDEPAIYRNLISGTKNPSLSVSKWNRTTGWNGLTAIDPIENALKFTATNGWNTFYYDLPNAIGKTVTVSGWFKRLNGSSPIGFNTAPNRWGTTYSVTASTTEWTYNSFTFTVVNNSAVQLCLLVPDNSTTSETLFIKEFQVEYGSKATEWSESAYDVPSQNRNLISGTKSPYLSVNKWDKTTTYSGSYGVDTENNALKFTAITGWNTFFYALPASIGQTVTVSGWFKRLNGSSPIGFNTELNRYGATYPIVASTANWTFNAITFTIANNSALQLCLSIPNNASSSESILVRELQVEYGGEATTWTPAADDIQQALSRTGIDISAGKITLDAENVMVTGNFFANKIMTYGMNVADKFIVSPDGSFTSTKGRIGAFEIGAVDLTVNGTARNGAIRFEKSRIGTYAINTMVLGTSSNNFIQIDMPTYYINGMMTGININAPNGSRGIIINTDCDPFSMALIVTGNTEFNLGSNENSMTINLGTNGRLKLLGSGHAQHFYISGVKRYYGQGVTTESYNYGYLRTYIKDGITYLVLEY